MCSRENRQRRGDPGIIPRPAGFARGEAGDVPKSEWFTLQDSRALLQLLPLAIDMPFRRRLTYHPSGMTLAGKHGNRDHLESVRCPSRGINAFRRQWGFCREHCPPPSNGQTNRRPARLARSPPLELANMPDPPTSPPRLAREGPFAPQYSIRCPRTFAAPGATTLREPRPKRATRNRGFSRTRRPKRTIGTPARTGFARNEIGC